MTIDTKTLRDLIARASPLPWLLATSNSWRRIVDANHAEVCTPCTQPDGHPDLQFVGGYEGANAQLLIEAVNSLPDLLDTIDGQTAEIAEAKGQIEQLDGPDAHILAASRDMYEALQEALELLYEINPLEGDTMRRIRAAIAKAEGKS